MKIVTSRISGLIFPSRLQKNQGTLTVTSPASEKVMTPPQIHISWETLSRVGMFASNTVGAPVTHGAGVFGIQGIGVSTPRAAAVAAATVGLEGDIHIPKGMIFVIGM